MGEFLPGAFLPTCRRKECGAPGEGGRRCGSKCCKSGMGQVLRHRRRWELWAVPGTHSRVRGCGGSDACAHCPHRELSQALALDLPYLRRGFGVLESTCPASGLKPLWVTPSTEPWAQIRVQLGCRGPTWSPGLPRLIVSITHQALASTPSLEFSQGEYAALLCIGWTQVKPQHRLPIGSHTGWLTTLHPNQSLIRDSPCSLFPSQLAG